MESLQITSGAEFSDCRKHRYALWRIWDDSKPKIMFVGLNPSTASEQKDDHTIKKVCKIANNLGYGGIYMVNCFSFVTPYPEDLEHNADAEEINDDKIHKWYQYCKDIVFAWGSFKVVSDRCRDTILHKQFPNAKALHINKNGSPKHPLYCKDNQQLINYPKNTDHA